MKVTREQAYEKIAQLVERFDRYVDTYKRTGYNEEQTRVDFINPFFKALGWDVDNVEDHAEPYRDVIHEDKIKIGATLKAPDYAFTLYGQRKFFVDAKKPSVNVRNDLLPAYQVRRYGWSAKVPISIVTDFEEFAIYDCTKKPNPKDKPSVARIRYFTYRQYLNEFEFFWENFSKENILKGNLDEFVRSDVSKKGTATVDNEFLKSIEDWRKYLATNIAIRNKTLNEDEINYAVQKTIDRILFLRICEDRGVELYGRLKQAIKVGEIYKNLFKLYLEADNKYNSGLFDMRHDRITPGLVIDNKILKNIINDLYYPRCEYEFSVMPADILGSVYERFLGKTIRLTKAHQARIEEKPEVRKAGGVYYTPKYIVDYIVQNTVGKLLEGKTPAQAAKLKICDPACGSGSFLIGAYQYLLDWHLRYYTGKLNEKGISLRRGDKVPKSLSGVLTPDGQLTTSEKKRILLNNIYGVDIDSQAVEVTKLNLLLKAMEGETQASIRNQLTMFQDRVLPNLDNNIKCGNSLIGPDFYDERLELFPELNKKINAFDWEAEFPDVFRKSAGKDGKWMHVVFAIKNSRYSHLHIHRQHEPGLVDVANAELNDREQALLTETLCQTARELSLQLAALNVCHDHVHALLYLDENQLPDAMRLWKGKTAYIYNRRVNPSVDERDPVKPDGTKQELWAKGYSETIITSRKQLKNTIRYIQDNRLKHGLPPLPVQARKQIEQVIQPPDTPETNSGFDAVIGNPPYVRQELLGDQKEYFSQHYRVYHGMADLYTYFFEKGINLLNSKGLFGIIVANKWMRANYGEPLRKWLKEKAVYRIVDFGDLPVFQDATTYPCIVLVGPKAKGNNTIQVTKVETLAFNQLEKYVQAHEKPVSKANLTDKGWQLVGDEEMKVLNKLKEESIPLGEYVHGKIFRGVLTGLNEAFIIDELTRKRLVEEDPKSAEIIKPFLAGRDIKRYQPPRSGKYLLLIPKGFTNEKYRGKRPWNWFSENYPAIARHLVQYEEKAKKRYDKGDYWWELRACEYYEEFEKPKILLPDIALRPQAMYDNQGFYCVNTAYIMPVDDKFLLAILNSKLVRFFYSNITSTIRGGYMRFIRQYLEKIPISTNTNPILSALVDNVLQLNQQLCSVTLETERQQLQRAIDHAERKIDELVYGLYGLTEEEIKIIENNEIK